MGDNFDGNPVRALAQHLGGPLGPGQVAFVTAKAGVGKSAMLVQVALEQLLQDRNVLHVALSETVEHVRTHYDQVFRATAKGQRSSDRASAMVAAERHRMIHTWVGRGFSVEALVRSLEMLQEMAGFTPALLIVDGLVADDVDSLVPGLAAVAAERGLTVWLGGRELVTGAGAALWQHVRVGLRLSPESASVRLTRLDPDGGAKDLPLSLDPVSLCVIGDGVGDEGGGRTALRAADCTLYSGGANGAEQLFGEIAERWGVQEVNFTFDGHKQTRARGRYVLSSRELAAGDVSLVYVSRRLNRTYSEGTLIRKVLQTLWHMVSRSQQVFVIGQIQEDGTVVGGTGWSVELARMWNKALWVFDQDQDGWFRWDGDEWVPGTPVIESVHLTGTGTRYLKENSKQAIAELFERSFAPAG